MYLVTTLCDISLFSSEYEYMTKKKTKKKTVKKNPPPQKKNIYIVYTFSSLTNNSVQCEAIDFNNIEYFLGNFQSLLWVRIPSTVYSIRRCVRRQLDRIGVLNVLYWLINLLLSVVKTFKWRGIVSSLLILNDIYAFISILYLFMHYGYPSCCFYYPINLKYSSYAYVYICFLTNNDLLFN